MTIKKFFGGSLFFVFFASMSSGSQELIQLSPMVHKVVDFMGSPVGAGLCYGVKGAQIYHTIQTLIQSRPYFTLERFSDSQKVFSLLNMSLSAVLSIMDKRLLLSTFAPEELYDNCYASTQCCESLWGYYPRAEHLFNMIYFSMISLSTARYAYNVIYKSDIYPNPTLHTNAECPICFKQNQANNFITPCSNNHALCLPCFDVMLQVAENSKPKCPLCREKMMPRTRNYPSNIIDRVAGTASHDRMSLKCNTLVQLMTFTFFFIQFYHFLYGDYYINCAASRA